MKADYSAISVDSEGHPLVERLPPPTQKPKKSKRAVLMALGALLLVAGAAVAYSSASQTGAVAVVSIDLAADQAKPMPKTVGTAKQQEPPSKGKEEKAKLGLVGPTKQTGGLPSKDKQ